MKFALVLCIAALGSQNFQAYGNHHHHHHHHQHSESPHLALAQVYTPYEQYGNHHHHHHNPHHYHQHMHHFKDNLGATIHTSYCGTSFEPSDCGQPECVGSYSGSNVFVHPASGSYDKFAVKCRTILQSLLDFISRPVEFGCTPGSALNLDLKSHIVNHNMPCNTVCFSEGGIVPVVEDDIVSTPSCNSEIIPVEVHSVRPQVTSDCGTCTPTVSPAPTVIPIEVAPVCESVHRVHHVEPKIVPTVVPAVVPTHHYRDVVYEQPTEVVYEEEDPKETKHQIHHLQKQLHHMLHNQKKHHHHHH